VYDGAADMEDGIELGPSDGKCDDPFECIYEGCLDGVPLGINDGELVGSYDGRLLGLLVGCNIGLIHCFGGRQTKGSGRQ